MCPMSRRKCKTVDKNTSVGFDLNGDETYADVSESRKRVIGLHFTSERMLNLMPDIMQAKGAKVNSELYQFITLLIKFNSYCFR